MRGGRALGALGDVDELDGAAAADLLAEAAGEALERALGDPLGALEQLGRRADDDHARAGLEAAQHGGEEVAQRVELGRVGDAGGVEDQALEPLALAGGPWTSSEAMPRASRRPGSDSARRPLPPDDDGARRPAGRRRCTARAWSGSAARGS